MNNSASVFTRIREKKRGREAWRVGEEPSTGSVAIGSGGSVVPRLGQVGGLSTPMTVVGILDPLLVSRYWSTESVT